VEPAEVRIVGDAPDALETALRDGLRHDLLVVSGGLGPTHDDRTVEALARASGRELLLDEELESQIEARSRVAYAAGIRKQAMLPEGAVVVGLAGTAPALVLEVDGCVAIVLPGPPRELQALWAQALATEPVQKLLSRATAPERHVLRFYGVGESAVAAALAAAGGDGDGVEVTICARDFETHVDLLGSGPRATALEEALGASLADYLFARSDEPVEALVLEGCRTRGLTLATAESCTGGLVAARLTSVAGSSDVFLGGIVSYANEVKASELGVPEDVLRAYGAVSPETAAAMAQGVRERLQADVGVSVTGIAGPGGGTPEKPVGLVYAHVVGPGGARRAAMLDFPGDRETIRSRATVAALQLVLKLVAEL
jgi:nicotinamide-nucleotide amidase